MDLDKDGRIEPTRVDASICAGCQAGNCKDCSGMDCACLMGNPWTHPASIVEEVAKRIQADVSRADHATCGKGCAVWESMQPASDDDDPTRAVYREGDKVVVEEGGQQVAEFVASESDARFYQDYLKELAESGEHYAVMTPERDPFLVALGKFDDAGRELLRQWNDVDSDGNHPIVTCGAYPFGASFDEIASNIWTWAEEARQQADKLFNTAVTPADPNDCAECARSFGPHYSGPCEHSGREPDPFDGPSGMFNAGFARLSLLIVMLIVLAFGAVVSSQSRINSIQSSTPIQRQPVEVKVARYCGAPTKKGTACRNRVKKAGELCWIHRAKGGVK